MTALRTYLKKDHRFTILILICIQLLLTLPFINFHPIALDEPFTIFHSQKSFGDLLSLFTNENNPPLHFILVHFWIKLFGIGVVQLRLLSLIFSLITIPILFNLSLKIFNKQYNIALLISGLFIFSTFHHFHAVEIRVYSILVLLFSLIVSDLYRLIFEQAEGRIWTLIFWNICLIYAHYLGFIIIISELIIGLVFIRQISKTAKIKLLIGALVMVLSFIPIMQIFLTRLGTVSSSGTWVQAPHWTELYGNILRFFNGTVAFFLILFVLLILFIREKNKDYSVSLIFTKKNVFIILFFAIPYFGMYLISIFFEPVFIDRYLLFTTIPLYLTFGIVVKYITQNKLTFEFVLIALLPLIIFLNYEPNNDREPDKIASYLATSYEKQEATIIICPPYFDKTLLYHLDQNVFSQPVKFDSLLMKRNIFPIFNSQELASIELMDIVRFIDVNASFTLPENNIIIELLKSYDMIDSAGFKGGVTVYKLSKK